MARRFRWLVLLALAFLGSRTWAVDHFRIYAAGGTSPIAAQTAGQSFSIRIVAYADATATTIDTAFTGTVTLASDATITSGSTTAAFIAGDLASHAVTVSLAATARSISVTDPPGGTSNTFNVVHGTATSFAISGTGTQTAGTAQTLTVAAYDALGNPATGYTGSHNVTFSGAAAADSGDAPTATNSSASAIAFGAATALAFTAGQASTSLRLYRDENATISATAAGMTTSSALAVDVAPAAAATFTVAGFADPTVAGVAHNVTVTAKDAYANTATGYAGIVHLTSSDPAATLPADGGLVAGVATLSVTLETAGARAITATDTVTTSITGSQGGIDVTPAAANQLYIAAIPATATAGTLFSPQPVIHIQDEFGNLVDDDTTVVTAGLTTGTTGQFRGVKTATATNGVATFTDLYHDRSQDIVIQFTAPSLASAPSGTITVSPGTPASLQVAGFTSPQSAGTAGAVTVTVLDGAGNTVTGYTGTIAFTSDDAQAVLPANYTFVAGDNGAHTFNGIELRTAGTRRITATATVTTTLTGAQTGITVDPATADRLVFTTHAGGATAGAAFTTQPVVRTRDAYGNNSTVGLGGTVTVTMTLSSGSGSLAGTTGINVGTSGTPGIATFTDLRIDNASDAKTLTAAATLGSPVSIAGNPFTVSPAAADHLAIQTQPPTTVGAGVTFSPAPVVRILDQFGNLRSGDTTAITAARSGGSGTLQGTTTVNAVAGQATFSNLSHPTANTITVRFTGTGLTAVTSDPVDVIAGAAVALRLTGSGTQVAGGANPITITALDSLGNPATAYAGAVGLTFSGAGSSGNPVTAPTVLNGSAVAVAFGGTTTLTFTNGVATSTMRLYQAGSPTISVTDGTRSATGANDLDVTVTAATASRLVVTGPANLTAGVLGNLTITATDPYGNTDTTYINSHSLVFSGASSSTNPVTAPTVENSAGTQIAFGAATSLSFTAGVASVSGGANGQVRLFHVEAPYISASDGTIGAAGNDRLQVAVAHATANKLVVTGSSAQVAGQTQDITLTIQDAYGNTATGSSGAQPVTFAGTGTGSGFNTAGNQPRVSRRVDGTEVNLGSVTSLEFLAGVASTGVDAQQCRMRLVRTGSASITATSGSLAASTPLVVTVTSGPATHLAITDVNGGANPTAGAAISVVVEARDAGDNPVAPAATTSVGLGLNHASTTYPASLTGTTSGTLSTSQSAITISGVRCNQVGVTPFWLTASDVTSPANATTLVAGDSATFTVLNDTPSVTIANATPLSYVGGSGTRVLDASATISDVSSSLPNYFSGGTLTASINPVGIASEDVLLILSSTPITTTGGSVYYDDPPSQVQIGTYTGGTANTTLTITLNANATPAAVDALVKKLAYLNLAGTVPTTTTRTVQVRLTDGLGAASAFANRTVVPTVGNELPQVTRNTGLTVLPSVPVTVITDTHLQTTDLDNPASQLLYTVTATPNQGSIERNGVPLAVNDTFTQEDIDDGMLQYRYVPGPLPSVSFTFTVEDGINQPLPVQAFVISIQGAAQNPVIILPGGTLTYTERSATAAVVEASSPNTAQTMISDSFSPSYDDSWLDVQFVDGAGQPASHAGDQLGIRDQTADCPPPILYPQNPDFSTGWIALGGGVVYHRQYPFYYYWANNYPGFNPPYTVFNGTFPSPPSVGYPTSWYWNIPIPLDYAIADVDTTLDGTNGKILRLRLKNGIAPIPDYFFGTPQYIVSRSSVARLIANTTFRNTSYDPPTAVRSLRFTLTVGAPTGTGGVPVGVASRQVQVSPVNDPPSFLSTSLALTTLAGIPLNAVVAATDQEAAQTRTYSLVSNSAPASGTFTLNSSTGGFTFVPQTAFAGTTVVVVRVTDNLGASTGTLGNPDATVTITTLAGTTSQQPFVISDPPLEVEEGSQFGVSTLSAYTISVLTNEARGPANVTVQLVGNYPAGTTVTAGPVATTGTAPYLASFSLTSALPITRPTNVHYQFGLRVIADYGGGVLEVGYQPITLRVRALGAPN